ncbi:MAG TPA: serpin family protein [Polyangiaceae bacterium]
MRSILALAPLLVLAACNSSSSPPVAPTPVTPPPPVDTTTPDAQVAPEPASTIADPGRSAIEAAHPTAVAIDRTNVDLYAKLASRPGNLIYSPASIETALAMAAAGAKGPTLAEMQKTLHLPADPQQAANDFSSLLASWAQSSPEAPALSVANHVWIQNGYPIVPAYLSVTRDKYFAPAESIDFLAADAAAKTINGWVAKNTHDKITELVQAQMLSNVRLVITNAVYFRGNWQTQFDKSMTTDGDFTTDGGAKVKAKLMNKGMSVPYADLPNAQIVDLPYKSTPTRELVFTVVLPKAGTSLSALEQSFKADSIDTWTKGQHWGEVIVTIPKFKTSFSTSLSKDLVAMGMPTAFSDKADFTGIATAKEGLHISEVVHKAMIEVDETGTEAAAATAVMAAGGGPPPANPPTFKADHPFLFFLRDKTTGAVLFAGRIVDPTKT